MLQKVIDSSGRENTTAPSRVRSKPPPDHYAQEIRSCDGRVVPGLAAEGGDASQFAIGVRAGFNEGRQTWFRIEPGSGRQPTGSGRIRSSRPSRDASPVATSTGQQSVVEPVEFASSAATLLNWVFIDLPRHGSVAAREPSAASFTESGHSRLHTPRKERPILVQDDGLGTLGFFRFPKANATRAVAVGVQSGNALATDHENLPASAECGLGRRSIAGRLAVPGPESVPAAFSGFPPVTSRGGNS